MLDINLIRENPDQVKKATKDKGLDPKVVDEVLKLDKERRALIQLVEKNRKIINETSNKVQAEKDDKKRLKLIAWAKIIKGDLKNQEPQLKEIKKQFHDAIISIPNPASPDVKTGKDETENEVIRKWGKLPKFNFEPKDHLELGQKLGLIDIDRAAKISGARFTYLTNDAVLLEFALINFALATLIKKRFVPILPPMLMKVPVFHKLGYSEHQGHGNYYFVIGDPNQTSQGEEETGYYLVGTAEHSIVPYFKDEILGRNELPKRFVGFSSAFRREAGSYGKDTKGILRVHQFDKVEMVSFTKPEESDKEHELLLSIEEELLQALEIPYQVVKMCSGDLGAPAARKYDLEAWIPSQNKYRELTSTSTCTDFQSRRLNIKYKDIDKTQYVHTLNGTAFAIGRTIIAIMENFQRADGSIAIPEVLHKYMGKKVIKPYVAKA